MRFLRHVIIFFVICIVGVANISSPTYAVDSLAQCDACGLCKNTKKSGPSGNAVYTRPANWDSCVRCIYPELTLEKPCSSVSVVNSRLQPIESAFCDTLIISGTPIQPAQGRQYTDVGCISVSSGSFIDGGASVDVVKRMLDIVTTITGGIGMVFLLRGALQLLLSRGNPDAIREGRKTIINAFIGVAFTLFALFIFRFVAQDVLRIPGLE